MAQSRSGPPPVPPRVDLGETEDVDSQEIISPGAVLPSMNGETGTLTQPTAALKDNKSEDTGMPSNTVPIASKPVTPPVATVKQSPPAAYSSRPSPLVKSSKPVPPVTKAAKPGPKREEKNRPIISIVSARPMDQASSFPSVHFNNDKSDVDTQKSNVDNNISHAQSSPPVSLPAGGGLKKPSNPAPRKPPTRPENENLKVENLPRKSGPVAGVKTKKKSSTRDTGSVFYIDTASTETVIDSTSSSQSVVDNSSKKAVQKSKSALKQKPNLPAPAQNETRDEKKVIDPAVNTKVKPQEKSVTKPKLKPTIITAKTPKYSVENKSKDPSPETIGKAIDESRPSRPSFPPSAASSEELNRHSSQPQRHKAPPNAIKDEKKTLETKREQKKDSKTEQSGKQRAKAKPPRPPMAKESARLKPTRPAPAKPNVTRKSSSEAADAQTDAISKNKNSSIDKPTLTKPSGPPRAQAKFDYYGETQDDLTFKAGDTIMLSSKVDDDWFVGYRENDVMHQGLIPSSFIEIIVALKEQPKEVQKSVLTEPHAIALHDFQGQNEQELSFSSGQTIILLERINAEWMKGKLNESIGIFPVNFVQIEHDLPLTASETHVPSSDSSKGKSGVEEWCRALHNYEGEHSDDLSFTAGAQIKIIERISQDWFKGEYSGKRGIFPASFVEAIAESSKGSQDSSLVTAIHNYSGDNPGDLSFQTGDKIKVIERINSDWLMGEFKGRQGLFPASFVETPQPASVVEIEKKEQTKEVYMAKAIHAFTGENPGELHFSVGDRIQVLREVDDNWSEGMIENVSGIFPTAFVEIQTASSKGEVYAKALYDFAGESDHDLSFKAGDIIQLLEHVNEEWCLGSVGGKNGHFPSSFVEILASR